MQIHFGTALLEAPGIRFSPCMVEAQAVFLFGPGAEVDYAREYTTPHIRHENIRHKNCFWSARNYLASLP